MEYSCDWSLILDKGNHDQRAQDCCESLGQPQEMRIHTLHSSRASCTAGGGEPESLSRLSELRLTLVAFRPQFLQDRHRGTPIGEGRLK